MSVYIIHAPAISRVKIGYASNPRKRFSGLRTSSPVDLELLAVIPGDRDCERALHARFSVYRCDGDWFDATPAIMGFAANFPSAGAGRIRASRSTKASDVAVFIDQLGGTVKVAAALELSPTTVSSWKSSNSIPRWRRKDLLALASEANVTPPNFERAA